MKVRCNNCMAVFDEAEIPVDEDWEKVRGRINK